MEAHIPSFITERFSEKDQHGTFKAAAMFVDISGFTPLTEALLKHHTEGAEILSEILDSIFKPLVAKVYAHAGIIPHFAGDAFTAIFPETPTATVAEIAEYIKQVFEETPSVKTRFGAFTINVRIGLSYGIVEWGIVGKNQKTFYFKGSAIERATRAQQQALPQQIIADEWFTAATIDPVSANLFAESIVPNTLFLANKFTTTERSANKFADTDGDALHDFFSHNMLEIQGKGEFRNVVAVFIAFSDAHFHKDIETLSNIVLQAFANFGGYFKELDFSEKYGVMVGFFGAPIAYENNGARALECVLSIRDEVSHFQETQGYKVRFGLASGNAYTGMIGGIERSQYAVVGNRVNLAARLMQNATWGEIWVHKSLVNTRLFDFQDKGTLCYKGIEQPIHTFQLLKKRIEDKPFFTGAMVGRHEELQALTDFIQPCFTSNKNGIATIYGEAGIGKSRLLYELRLDLEERTPIYWANCAADQILRKPFNPFVYFLKQFFNQNNDGFIEENKRVFEKGIENLFQLLENGENTYGTSRDSRERELHISELQRTQSVLAALIGLYYPDSLWEQLDAKGRYDNTWAALSNFFIVLSHIQPLVIELEDAHWLDDDSTAFLTDCIKKIAHKPIVLIITSRYDDEGEKKSIFEVDTLHKKNIYSLELDLSTFTKTQLENFTTHKLKAEAHTQLLDTLWRTSNGNPFYIEQILDYFIENKFLQLLDNKWLIQDKTIKISTSVTAILTARIDRLSSILKETVKAAAVIGREFELPILGEVMLAHEEYIRCNGNGNLVLKEQIETAEKGQIWQSMNELRYIFRHALLREAIYDMQLKTNLRVLHALIAKAIEKIYADRLNDRSIDLAFHYEQAENKPKTIEYLKIAADHARRNFQNQQALELYDRLLNNITDSADTLKTQIRKGEVLQLIGQWQGAEKCFQHALKASEKTDNIMLKGRATNALGTLLMLKGNYKEAQKQFETSANYFEQHIEFQGITKVYGNLGNLYFRQGSYEKATDYFTQSISLSLENGLLVNPQIVSNLGLTYMNLGNFTEGVRVQEEALVNCEKNNDLVGQAILSVNLGIVWFEKGNTEAALTCIDTGLSLAQKLGNKQLTSIALGCIGNIWLLKGNFEKTEYYLIQDLNIVEELGDRQGIAIASELMGKLYHAKGLFEEALPYFEVSLSLCRALNYQKGIAKALIGMGDIYVMQKDYREALECFEKATEIALKISNTQLLTYAHDEKEKTLQLLTN